MRNVFVSCPNDDCQNDERLEIEDGDIVVDVECSACGETFQAVDP